MVTVSIVPVLDAKCQPPTYFNGTGVSNRYGLVRPFFTQILTVHTKEGKILYTIPSVRLQGLYMEMKRSLIRIRIRILVTGLDQAEETSVR